MPSTLSNLFNHFMELIGLNYYNKNESDSKYALKSDIPAELSVDSSLSASSMNPVQNKVVKNALDGKSDITHNHTKSDISDFPIIPSKTSELDNDSNFVTTEDSRLSDARTPTSHVHTTGDVKDTSAYGNIGSSANATQKTINSNINTKLGEKAVASNVYSKSETYTQSEITTLISNAVSDLQLFEVVNSLPTSNIKTNRLYLIVNNESIANNLYDIYLRVNNSWEQLDSLDFDISNFYNKTEMDTLLSGKVDTSDSRLTNARTPTSHTHGDITNTGTIGSTANKPLITTTNGKITVGTFGTSENTFAEGNHTHNQYLTTSSASSTYVAKDGTKVLSTNDFTDSYKTSLDNLSSTIANAVGNLELFEVVNTLPSTNIKNNKLYIISNGNTTGQDRYDIYLRVNNEWEKIDSGSSDVSNFIQKSNTPGLIKNDGTIDTTQYLTSHQDISGKLNITDFSTELEEVIDSLITEAQS